MSYHGSWVWYTHMIKCTVFIFSDKNSLACTGHRSTWVWANVFRSNASQMQPLWHTRWLSVTDFKSVFMPITSFHNFLICDGVMRTKRFRISYVLKLPSARWNRNYMLQIYEVLNTGICIKTWTMLQKILGAEIKMFIGLVIWHSGLTESRLYGNLQYHV